MTDGTYEVVEITTSPPIATYILKIEKAREKWRELIKDGWTFDETKRKHDEFLRKCNHSFTSNQKMMKKISDSMEAYVKQKKLRWDNYALEA